MLRGSVLYYRPYHIPDIDLRNICSSCASPPFFAPYGSYLLMPVLQVQDSDEEKRSQVSGGDRRRTSPFIPDAKALLHKFVVKATATHPNTLGPQGLKRVARHMLSPSAGLVPGR